MATQNLTIMFTDIKGFTERTSGTTRAGMKSILAEHDRLLVPVFQYFDGRIVKTIGDAFLVTFASPTDAVLCGVTIQEVLRQHNLAADEERRLDVRVAINVGEVELKDNDVLGEPVNIAARLEGVTEAGEVYFTDAVYQTMNRSEAPSADVGEKLFKGIPHPVRVYRVLNEPGSELATRLANGVRLSERGPVLAGIRDTIRRRRLKRNALLAIAAAALAGVAIAVVLLLPGEAERARETASSELAAGRPAAALDALGPALAAAPADAALHALALEAATQHLAALGAGGEHETALEWLEKALSERPYLEPLRPRLVELEAWRAARRALSDPEYAGQYYPKPLKEYLARHPEDPRAAQALDAALAERGDAMTRVWLQREALDRGLEAPAEMLAYNLALQENGPIDWQLLDASRSLLTTFYPEETAQWAATALGGANVLAFGNAWLILEQRADPRLAEPFNATLRSLVRAGETVVVDEAMPVLAAEQDPERRAQALAFIDELVTTFPRFLNSGDVRDRLREARATLEAGWSPQG